jgi:arginase
VRVEIIAVPFDSGLRDSRMGRGPNHLLALGLAERLQALGADVRVCHAEPPLDVYPSEIRMALELQRAVAHAVSDAQGRGFFPLVLSGNCNIAVGVVAAVRTARGSSPAVCWFDAHADFNTPETTIGGFLDGMAVSMLTGHCWHELTAQVPGFAPIPDAHVLMIGTRDVDPLERELLQASSIRVASRPAEPGADVDAIIAAAGAPDLYLHLDLDALDASEGRANGFAVSGGLSHSDLLVAIDAIGSRGAIRAASITAYDPACDTDDRIGHIAIEAATRIVGAARSRD